MNIRALALLAGLLLGCGPKEARDPSEILAEDPAFRRSMEESRGEAKPTSAPPPRLATRGECESAVRRVEELGLEIAIAEARSEEERADLEARRDKLMSSPALRDRVDRGTQDCLDRETPAREAECIVKAQSAEDVDRCTQ